MSELVFLLSADVDIQTAYEFYEACQSGRGAVFMRHLDAAFARLRDFPESAEATTFQSFIVQAQKRINGEQ